MNLPRFAMRYPAIVITAVGLAIMWGVITYFTAPRSEDPEFTLRVCTITTSWPGQTAEKVEELVTDKIEKAVDAIDEVKEVRSRTTSGLSVIYVELEDSVAGEWVDNIWDKVRAKVDEVIPGLPQGVNTPHVNSNFADTSVMVLAVYQNIDLKRFPSQPVYSMRRLEIIAEDIMDEIKLLHDVANAELVAVREEAIWLETDAGHWSQLNITTDQLRQRLQTRNIVAPGGTIDTELGRFGVKPAGEFNAVDEIENLIVEGHADGAPVLLKDLGITVRRGYIDPPTQMARFRSSSMKEPADCVVISFTMKDGRIITDLGEEVDALLARLKKTTLPADIEIAVLADQPEMVNTRISDFVWNLSQAVVIVVLVAYLLIGFRIALIMAAAIPIVIIASLGTVRFLGVGIEQISIASFIIALGMLVDNAIEVCDNVHRLLEEGWDRKKAAIEGSRQIAFPVLIATLTTIFAFLPMLTIPGNSGEFLYSLPVVVSTTLGISWIIAMTMTTLMAYWFMRKQVGTAPIVRLAGLVKRVFRRPIGNDPMAAYTRLCERTLRHKFITVLLAFGAFFGSLLLVAGGFIGTQYFPDEDRHQFVVEIHLPEGSPIGRTEKVCTQVEQLLQRLSPIEEDGETHERLSQMLSYIGIGGPRFYISLEPQQPAANYAMILVNTTNRKYANDYIREIRDEASRRIAGARVIPRKLAKGPPVAAPVSVRVLGDDMLTLRAYSDQVKDALRSTGLTWDIHDTWGNQGYQILIATDEDKAKLAGLTQASVAQSTNAFFSGHFLTTYREGDHQVPIYLRLPAEQRGHLDQLKSLFVEGSAGKVPLDAVADVRSEWVPAKITRYHKRRNMEVRARPIDGVLANAVVSKAKRRLNEIQASMPAGYELLVAGEQEKTSETQGHMQFSFAISLLLIVMCLVVKYNAFGKPIIILLTIPLAATGAILGLFFTGTSLGFMAMLGCLSLAGVVLNDTIVLVEFAEIEIREKLAASEGLARPGEKSCGGLSVEAFRACIVRAGRMRMLPICLTTLTTVGGLAPLIIWGGAMWRPLAVVVSCGLLWGTAMTLLVLPAVFAIFVEHFGMKPVPVTEEGLTRD